MRFEEALTELRSGKIIRCIGSNSYLSFINVLCWNGNKEAPALILSTDQILNEKWEVI
jgi:hypothetical protein